jgi:hypothetical protein
MAVMYHYDPVTALEELNEDATLPNPVHVRDMILRRNLTPERALELNREFQEYQRLFGEILQRGKTLLGELAEAPPK